MRTTVNLDEEVVRLVRSYARSRSLSLGKALCEFARRGCGAHLPTRMINGLLVFDPPPDSPTVTMQQVRRIEDASAGLSQGGRVELLSR